MGGLRRTIVSIEGRKASEGHNLVLVESERRVLLEEIRSANACSASPHPYFR
jgi:hypothetical protein